MPYGLPKELDTPGNNAKMERCVQHLKDQGNDDEVSCIRICKASLIKHANKPKKQEATDPEEGTMGDMREDMMRGKPAPMPTQMPMMMPRK